MQQTKKGFTLIELLVVIAIIGILSAIGLVSLNGARERARDAKRKSDLAQISTALALYYDDNNALYPPTGVANNAAGEYSVAGSTWDTVLVPTYVQSFPIADNPGAANGYWYITNDASLTDNTVAYAQRKVYALATTLEGGNKDWYIINSLGYAKNKATALTLNATNMTCQTSAGATISACLSAP